MPITSHCHIHLRIKADTSLFSFSFFLYLPTVVFLFCFVFFYFEAVSLGCCYPPLLKCDIFRITRKNWDRGQQQWLYSPTHCNRLLCFNAQLSGLQRTPSSCQQCIFKAQITLAIVKSWPAYRDRLCLMCISVSFVRQLNTTSVLSMTKKKTLGDTRREVLSFLCFFCLGEPNPQSPPTKASIHTVLLVFWPRHSKPLQKMTSPVTLAKCKSTCLFRSVWVC